MHIDAEIDSVEEDRSVSVTLKKGIDRQSSMGNPYGFSRPLATGIRTMSNFRVGKAGPVVERQTLRAQGSRARRGPPAIL